VCPESPDGGIALVLPKHPDGPLNECGVKRGEPRPSFLEGFCQPFPESLRPAVEIFCVDQPTLHPEDHNLGVVTPDTNGAESVTSIGNFLIGEWCNVKPSTDVRRLWVPKARCFICVKIVFSMVKDNMF
jgi:hypothetical protein